MYNLILTLSVYSFMTISMTVLLTVIILRQEQGFTILLLAKIKQYPINIIHRDTESKHITQLLHPVSLAAYSA